MSQSIQIQPILRRWCRECGTPGPIDQPKCLNCQAAVLSPNKTVSRIFNEGNGMVQNNVYNIDPDRFFGSVSETQQVSEHPGFFHRFFMFTCAVGVWCGILTFSSVMLIIFSIIVLAAKRVFIG